MVKTPKPVKFEEAIEKLEGFIAQLEQGEVPLDESLKLFEEGMELAKWCESRLTEVEGRIETLTKSGSILMEPGEEKS